MFQGALCLTRYDHPGTFLNELTERAAERSQLRSLRPPGTAFAACLERIRCHPKRTIHVVRSRAVPFDANL